MGYYEDLNNGKVGKSSDAHYISAYGIAKKHGFVGSEEEWLESLSDYGIAKKHGFTGSEEEWNAAVNTARDKAITAQTAAEAAKSGAEAAKSGAVSARDKAITAQTAAETAKSGAETAKSDAEAARDEAEVVKSDVEKIAGELSGYIKESEIFKKSTFAWTDFPYTADGTYGLIGKVNADSIVIDNAEENESIDISCYGYRLGFKVTVSGWGRLRINGENRVIEDETVVFPPTYISSVLSFFGDGSTWTFTDMVKQIPILGIPIDTKLNADSDNPIANSAVSRVVGDIDSALDAIIALQNELIGGEVDG